MKGYRFAFPVAMLLLSGIPASLSAQNVISAKSGLVHYVKGDVFVADKKVNPSRTHFPDVGVGQTLRTEQGRAEILLTPGTFLRVGEHSSFTMTSASLTDARLEILNGSFLLESADVPKGSTITLTYQGETISILKRGLYRIDTDPAELKVYDGKAHVASASTKGADVKAGKLMALEGGLHAGKFDKKKDVDGFYDWAEKRSGYLSMVNMGAARAMYDEGYSFRSNLWYFNPFYGAFTFMPYSGVFYSPFGYTFWSPREYYNYYYVRPNQGGYGGGWNNSGNSNSGYHSVNRTSSGTSGTVVSSGPPPSSAGSSAPVSRGSSRGGGGGR